MIKLRVIPASSKPPCRLQPVRLIIFNQTSQYCCTVPLQSVSTPLVTYYSRVQGAMECRMVLLCWSPFNSVGHIPLPFYSLAILKEGVQHQLRSSIRTITVAMQPVCTQLASPPMRGQPPHDRCATQRCRRLRTPVMLAVVVLFLLLRNRTRL